MAESLFFVKAAMISMIAGSLIGFALAAVDLPSPAPAESVGVMVGACNLTGLFVGHMVANIYLSS